MPDGPPDQSAQPPHRWVAHHLPYLAGDVDLITGKCLFPAGVSVGVGSIWHTLSWESKPCSSLFCPFCLAWTVTRLSSPGWPKTWGPRRVSEDLRKGCLALGLGPGRGAQLQAVCSYSLSVPSPRLCTCCVPIILGSWQLSLLGHLTQPPRMPRERPGSGFPAATAPALLSVPVRLCPRLRARSRSPGL